MVCDLDILLQGAQALADDPGLLPAVEPAGQRELRPLTFRQITPRCLGTQNLPHDIEDTQMDNGGTAYHRRFGGKEWSQPLPSSHGQCSSGMF